MPTYTVEEVRMKGSKSSSKANASQGHRLKPRNVEAKSRAMAYVQVYHEWSSKGLDVAARAMGQQKTGHDDQPLGFSKEEIEQIQKEGVPVKSNYPNGEGIQVENLYEAENT